MAANRAGDGTLPGRDRTSPAVNSRINMKYSFQPVNQVEEPAFWSRFSNYRVNTAFLN